jgi:GNAT superfamily N-acetyltransferase
MIIEEAKIEDVPRIVQLWLEFMKEHDEIIIKENSELSECEIKDGNMGEKYREFLISHIESKDGAVFIAKENNEIVGYCLIFIKDEIPIYKNKKIGCASDLYVKKNFRNQGISSKLGDKSIKWFKEKRIKFVSAPMYPDNRFAHSIFKKWGFFDYKVEMRKKV